MKKLAIALVFTLLLVGSVFASPRQNANTAPAGNMNAGGGMGRRHHRRHHRRARRHHRRHGRRMGRAANANT